MQFTEEVAWGVGDFVLFGGMLLLAGAAVETVIRTNPSSIYRYAMGGGLGGAFLLIWVNGAVGLIGAAGNPANLMYAGVLAVGVIGALVGRFRARAMSRVLLAMAVIQTVIMGTAIVMEWGQPSSGPVELVVANGAFAGIWLVSAWLFRKAERDGT
ncbi:hypothetical protein CRI94_11885 [Longibacter salinarum]|uniref:Uncharacterized protein n=2 Tax=Longibacter salinarum TaxID=1850348 RepID=A0A2A8CVK6_9BACT|nr:hypothetical protein CRI94_11885 [Longibacter salinarum]